MTHKRYDLVVVGAGSGGYAAARTARDDGASVALVDRGPLGGLCILRGCMPSKAFLASSDALFDAREAQALGIHTDAVAGDMPFIAARKRSLVKSFAEYRVDGIREFPLYEGEASFLSPRELLVQCDERVVLEAKHFIVATGSVVSMPPVPGLAQVEALDSDSVLELERVPPSVVVLGGGYTACELGQFLARMGARTTIVIRKPHLLSGEDADVGTTLMQSFIDEGIDVISHAQLLAAERRDGKKVVRFAVRHPERHLGNDEDSFGEVVADEIFNALGRTPDVAGLRLEAAGVAFDPLQGIGTDATLRTSNPDIFAIGDVTGEFLLVHVAIYQGEIAARNAVRGGSETAEYRTASAHTVFCDPQFARVGESEKMLQAAKTAYIVGRYDFAEHGKAMCLGKTKGFVKIMADRVRGEILGATVVGPQASELVHEMVVAMHYHATVDEFMRIPHLHPTLAEIWTYPAEECSLQLGKRKPGDEQIELATSMPMPT
jgi:pyruvate/2-oxoglutarate dehydrogenase complex dihydrolipoamide dehydrogenase (E3) component